ncbi:hypothetical protein IE53DRAFT_377048 [Violaceomyces palustris]|uniref:Uncharacterized protein n=1 Tax=Violaceomyces palustris TaxID=1673888 RepID=A0ACD0P6V4_9BASI|nr:hypothetical protein IE53DRAFT_377048 [Violaceomyces palustris]
MTKEKLTMLALHGGGVNSEIFATQSRSLREEFEKQVGKQVEWTFLQAPFASKPYPGIDRWFKGPWLVWWRNWIDPDQEEIERMVSWILSIAEDKGGFDGVVGFSQGAALAAEVLHAASCSNLPDRTIHHKTRRSGLREAFDSDTSSASSSDSEEYEPKATTNKRGSLLLASKSAGGGFRNQAARSGRLPLFRFGTLICGGKVHDKNFAPSSGWRKALRIEVPTAHILGRKDAALERGRELEKSCPPELVYKYEHSGGHEIPMTSHATLAMAKTMARAYKAGTSSDY